MITLDHVSKRFGARLALDDVSLEFTPGEITLLLGSNGAGKSTLLRCLLGICDYDGSIRVGGLDPLEDGCTVRSLIGYMPQAGGLHPDLTVAQTIELYSEIRSVEPARGSQLIDEAGLGDHRHVRVGDLSGGLQQRLGFALALLTDPPVLVLDEPSSSLDAASREWLAGRLRAAAAEGRVVIVSTHSGQELLSEGHRRVVLEEGRVVHADPANGRRWEAGHSRPFRCGNIGRALPLVAKEVKDAIGNRWLSGYALVLGVLGLAAAASGIESSSGLALQAFGRTTATLMNLCLLLAPLVAVVMGAAAIAGERERGTLENLLAQPFTRARLLLAKHASLVASLAVATAAGFAPAGLLILWSAGPGPFAHYLLFPFLAIAAAAAMAAVGLLISVSSRSAVQAQGTAIFTWFAFVLLYDLVLMGTLSFGGLPVQAVAGALIANPVDAARVLGVLALEPDLYLLGPAGAYLAAEFSRVGAALILVASLVAWMTGPVVLALFTFRIRPGRPARHAKRETMGETADCRAGAGAGDGLRVERRVEAVR
ncbi:MAG: ABC transporter permease subunit [Acidobacteriota bacterium]|nr:ABC transporter permease subunit [Acidobacteriota bacterium]